MEKIKKFLKEGTEALFLLLIAVLIFINFPTGSRYAESNSSVGEQISADAQVLGEDDRNTEESLPEVSEDMSKMSIEEVKTVEAPLVQGVGVDVALPDPEKEKSEKYDELKRHLKKYCDRKGSDNRKKCKKYCSKAKNISKKDARYDNLREKYCEDKKDKSKKESKKSNEVANEVVNVEVNKDVNDVVDEKENDVPVNQANELKFIAGSKEFKMEFEIGESIFSLMKRAKSQGKINFKYDDYGGDLGVMVTEINGVKNGSDTDWTQNKYWIIYVNGKSASIGCSAYKLNKSDSSVEWKYEKYSY